MKTDQKWQVLRIKDVGRVITGRTPSTKIESYFGDDYPFITPSDMDGRKTITETARGISEEGAQALASNRIPAGSVAVSCIGWQMGKVIVTGTTCFTNQQLNTILPNERVNADFLYYKLSTIRDKLKNLASVGTRTPILIKSTFENIELEFPPLPTQRRIASILSAYDGLIENNTRRIKILEQMAQAIYREWFVEFRAPGVKLRQATSEEQKVTGKDRFPVGWEIVKLGDVASVNPSSIKRGQEPETINYVDIASVSTGQIDKIEEVAFIDAPGRARRIVQNGDVIWSCVRPNRKSHSLIINPLPNLIVSTGFAVLRSRDVPFTFLYQAVTTEEFVGYLTNHATGAAYPAVVSGDFENAIIVKPPQAILDSFHQLTNDAFYLRQNLQAKNANLRQTRDLLLPRLVGGEVAV
jgi:type I restriction enzyme S subunit